MNGSKRMREQHVQGNVETKDGRSRLAANLSMCLLI